MSESARGVSDFRWEVGAFIDADGCEGGVLAGESGRKL